MIKIALLMFHSKILFKKIHNSKCAKINTRMVHCYYYIAINVAFYVLNSLLCVPAWNSLPLFLFFFIVNPLNGTNVSWDDVKNR
jgi:hypothetical protein